MQDAFAVFTFEVVANFVDFVIKIGSVRQHCDKVLDEERTRHSLLVVVLDLDVDYVNGNVVNAFSVLEKIDDLIVHSLFASDYHVKPLGAALELLGSQLQSFVSFKHV